MPHISLNIIATTTTTCLKTAIWKRHSCVWTWMCIFELCGSNKTYFSEYIRKKIILLSAHRTVVKFWQWHIIDHVQCCLVINPFLLRDLRKATNFPDMEFIFGWCQRRKYSLLYYLIDVSFELVLIFASSTWIVCLNLPSKIKQNLPLTC